MKKMSILVVAFVFGWLAVAQAQVWVDPYTRNKLRVIRTATWSSNTRIETTAKISISSTRISAAGN